MEEEIIGQIGLLLTQIRYSRRALEDIERNTATYGGFSFLQNLTPEARFGEPPLLNGALKVYVVNINDLTSQANVGGLIEGLLGGVGRFFGGLAGGVVGGTISGVALPVMIAQVSTITSRIERIIERLGFGSSTPQEAVAQAAQQSAGGGTATAPSSAEPATSNASGGFMANLPAITDLLLGLTALFRAAASGPGEGGPGPTARQREALNQLTHVLQPVYAILQAVGRILDGIILLIPIAVGAFAMLLVRISDLKLVFLELLQFLIRNIVLLRGIVLLTLFDTLSVAARLAANVLRIAATAINSILQAIFTALTQVIRSALDILRTVTRSIAATINALLPWLLQTIDAVLTFLGDTRIFRVFFHLVDILPNVLPPLVLLIRGTRLNTAEMTLIQQAASASVAAGAGIRALPSIPAFPNLSATLTPSADLNQIVADVDATGQALTTATTKTFSTLESSLQGIGRTLSREDLLMTGLDANIQSLSSRADALAGALERARQAAEQRPQTGLEAVATAYEEWLGGGGLEGLMQRLTDHFRNAPQSGQVGGTIPGRIVTETAVERARATVEIEEVVIEIEADGAGAGGETSRVLHPQYDIEEMMRARHDYLERGGRISYA